MWAILYLFHICEKLKNFVIRRYSKDMVLAAKHQCTSNPVLLLHSFEEVIQSNTRQA